MDPVIHFEIPVDDSERARAFYESAFAWQTMPLGPEMGDFVMAFTVESDQDTRIPKVSGAINGGFSPRTDSNAGVRVTILVDDLQAAVAKVEAAGGSVIGQPVELPGVGLFVSVADPEGNQIQLNQDFAVKRLPSQENSASADR